MNTVIKPALWAGLGLLTVGAGFGTLHTVSAADFGRAPERGWQDNHRDDRNDRNDDRRDGWNNDHRDDHRDVGPGRGQDNGHFELRTERVLVQPERTEQRYVQPVYETRYGRRHRPYQVLVSAGHYETVTIPAQYTTVENRVWVPDHRIVPVVAPPCPPGPVVVAPPVYTPAPPVTQPVVVERPKRNFFQIVFGF